MALAAHNANVSAVYHLDEAADTNATDALGTNNLTKQGTPGPGATTGPGADACRTFNGTDQYFSHADAAALSLEGGDFTVGVWAYATDQPGTLAAQWEEGVDGTFRLGLTAGGLFSGRVYNGGSETTVNASTFGAISGATWYCVVLRYDATADTLKVSVNGSANTDTTTSSVDPHATTKDFTVGSLQGGGSKLTGRLNELVLWKGYVLSDADVDEFYNAGAVFPYPFGGGSDTPLPTKRMAGVKHGIGFCQNVQGTKGW